MSFVLDKLECTPIIDAMLSYVSQLDPEIIVSLAQSVSTLHVDTLRDAIGKHLSRQTSLAVTIPVSYQCIF